MQNTIHFILQGKGGCGKSFVASLLAQFFAAQDADLKTFDTDQENNTFSQYQRLDVQHVPVMNASRTIDAKRFDTLMDRLLTEDGTFVVDNGANTFSPLLAYLVENDVVAYLKEQGKTVYVHTVVSGGDTLTDTINGFNSIARSMDTPLVLWLNEHFGPLRTVNGKDVSDIKAFKDNEERLHALVLLQEHNPQTYGQDIQKMNAMRLTVDEVMQSTDFTLMEKQRIRNVAKEVFGQLDKVAF